MVQEGCHVRRGLEVPFVAAVTVARCREGGTWTCPNRACDCRSGTAGHV